MDWITGESPCKLNCVDQCAQIEGGPEWQACVSPTAQGNRTCNLVGDCIRIQDNNTWTCGCTSFFIGDRCERYIWEEYPGQRLILLIVFSVLVTMYLLFLVWVGLATFTELWVKSCAQIRKRQWATKVLLTAVTLAAMVKLVHAIFILASGKATFYVEKIGYFSDGYQISYNSLLLWNGVIGDLLTYIAHDLLLCLPSTQIILWLELVTQIKLLQKKAPRHLAVLKYLVFFSALVVFLTTMVTKTLISLPRELTFPVGTVIYLEQITQILLLVYNSLVTITTLWLIFYVWRSLTRAMIDHPYLLSKMQKLKNRFGWFILLSVLYLPNFATLAYEFRTELTKYFLHPYKNSPSTVLHFFWALDYVTLFFRGIAGLMTTHTYLPEIIPSEEEISGLRWKENRIFFCLSLGLCCSSVALGGSYLFFNRVKTITESSDHLLGPIFVYCGVALAFINSILNLVLRKFSKFTNLPVSLWNIIVLAFTVAVSIKITFESGVMECVPFDYAKIGDISCTVLPSWIASVVASLFVLGFQACQVIACLYPFINSLFMVTKNQFSLTQNWVSDRLESDYNEFSDSEYGSTEFSSSSSFGDSSSDDERLRNDNTMMLGGRGGDYYSYSSGASDGSGDYTSPSPSPNSTPPTSPRSLRTPVIKRKTTSLGGGRGRFINSRNSPLGEDLQDVLVFPARKTVSLPGQRTTPTLQPQITTTLPDSPSYIQSLTGTQSPGPTRGRSSLMKGGFHNVTAQKASASAEAGTVADNGAQRPEKSQTQQLTPPPPKFATLQGQIQYQMAQHSEKSPSSSSDRPLNQESDSLKIPNFKIPLGEVHERHHSNSQQHQQSSSLSPPDSAPNSDIKEKNQTGLNESSQSPRHRKARSGHRSQAASPRPHSPRPGPHNSPKHSPRDQQQGQEGDLHRSSRRRSIDPEKRKNRDSFEKRTKRSSKSAEYSLPDNKRSSITLTRSAKSGDYSGDLHGHGSHGTHGDRGELQRSGPSRGSRSNENLSEARDLLRSSRGSGKYRGAQQPSKSFWEELDESIDIIPNPTDTALI